MSTVLVIGVGDMGERLATGLAGHLGVRRLLLAGRSAPSSIAGRRALPSPSAYDWHRVPARAESVVRSVVMPLLNVFDLG
jgi:pyrroline-5-carboxylate reductase